MDDKQYEEKGRTLIKNTTIDVVYDLVYSDKEVKIKGKDEPCYLGYVMKKMGGFNIKCTKLVPRGPKFYSQEDEVNFMNCSLFSEKIISYEVLLPPIPFLPKSCQSKEAIKMYWTSNESFDYVLTSTSVGAPSADSFYIRIVHRITQI